MENYVLDFLIPQGPTGPVGPNLPVCYVDYNTATNPKRLSIKETKMFHANGEFSVTGDTLSVHAGTYEVTFCGKIDVNQDFQSNITVSLQESLGGGYFQPVTGMTMVLMPGTNCMHFSETRIITFNGPEDIVVIITNNNAISVSATISMGSLLLKKIE